MSDIARLSEAALWASVLSDVEAARAVKGISERTYPAGAYICHRGDRLEYWTGVITGLVKISAISESGKAMTFAGIAPGGWFGEGTVLKGEARKAYLDSAYAAPWEQIKTRAPEAYEALKAKFYAR